MSDHNDQTASLIEQGLALINTNKLQEAKNLFTRLCETNPQASEAWYLLSTVNGRMGDIEAAGECCRHVLDIQPDHCEARVNLGNVLFSQGKLDDAIAEYQRVLAQNPRHAMAHNNLGLIFAKNGRFDEAAAHYQAAIEVDPNLILAYINLGNLRMQEEKYDKAANNFIQAARLNPGDPALRTGLGIALFKMGKRDDALASFHEAIRLKADYLDPYINLGNAYLESGDYNEALSTFKQALLVAPNSAEIHNDLGVVYLESGDIEHAIPCFQRALEINPRHMRALNNMGTASRSPERFASYLALYAKTVELLPNPEQARTAFINNIKFINPSDYDQWLDQELIKCFSIPKASNAPLALITARHLKHKYLIKPIAADDQNALRDIVKLIASDQLFLMFLQKTFNIEPELEFLLNGVRRHLLFKHCKDNGADRQELIVASALAYQGLNNEYIFFVDDEEQRLVSQLKNSIEKLAATIDSPNAEIEADLFIYAMYERLYSLSCRERLNGMPAAGWSGALHPLLEQTIAIPLEEEKIKQEIATVGNIEDKTSQLVQSQYEENPYPRWLSIPGLQKRNIKRVLKQRFPHFSPPDFLDGPLKILVAGCGTGQQPIRTALTYDNVEILAVDISKSSLAYAIRMAHRYGVNNIRFMQGDILQLAKLDSRFHIIECSGVLHHMKDPMQGWRVLSGLLVDNGLMSIALYSEKARKNIVAARELIQREKIIPDLDNIRNFRRRILRHETNDTLYELSKLADFYTTSRCRDLIFHFMEHRYTVPQLERAMAELQLEFIGFEFSDNTSVTNAYRNAYPQDPDMTNLALWDDFETRHPNTFARMYDFWCQKKT